MRCRQGEIPSKTIRPFACAGDRKNPAKPAEPADSGLAGFFGSGTGSVRRRPIKAPSRTGSGCSGSVGWWRGKEKCSVRELPRLSGASTRASRWYDEVGLLKPGCIGWTERFTTCYDRAVPGFGWLLPAAVEHWAGPRARASLARRPGVWYTVDTVQDVATGLGGTIRPRDAPPAGGAFFLPVGPPGPLQRQGCEKEGTVWTARTNGWPPWRWPWLY